MINAVPFYVSAVFILTAITTAVIFLHTIKRGAFSSTTTQILSFLIPFWLVFQAILSIAGFYLQTDSIPPRLPVFAVLPALLTIILLFIFARKNFLARLPLKTLTWLHVVRVPVEIVLLWLFFAKQVPQLMTFEGRNFDILSGITAPFVAWLAFRGDKVNRPLLIIWNIFALLLLVNIVFHAVLSIPTPLQKFAFDQPNVAVLYFPFIWLPSVVVPIVLFCHLVSLWRLFRADSKL